MYTPGLWNRISRPHNTHSPDHLHDSEPPNPYGLDGPIYACNPCCEQHFISTTRATWFDDVANSLQQMDWNACKVTRLSIQFSILRYAVISRASDRRVVKPQAVGLGTWVCRSMPKNGHSSARRSLVDGKRGCVSSAANRGLRRSSWGREGVFPEFLRSRGLLQFIYDEIGVDRIYADPRNYRDDIAPTARSLCSRNIIVDRS